MPQRLVIALFVSFAAFAAAPSIDFSVSARSVSGAQISPDGRYAAFGVQQANWDENEFVTQIWIAATATGARYQLTSGKKSSSEPHWSPDSGRIAFASERDGKRQIYVISPTGGEAAKLTSEENGVGSFAWSPDGQWMAYTSSGPETQGEQFTVGGFSWSPDGSQIAFDAARDPDLGSRDTQRIYVLELAGLHVRKLVDAAGPHSNPKWSPDGKQIAWVTSNGDPFFYFGNSYIAAVSAEGGSPNVLTRDFDEDPNLIDWAADGIYFGAEQKTAAHIYRLDPATGSVRRLSGPDQFQALGATFSKDHRSMAGIGGAPNRFAEVFVSSTSDFAPKYLSDIGSQWKEYPLATREVIQWKSGDGAAIEGVLIKPADYDASRRYPLLVVIHGGPTGVDTPVLSADRYYPVERFAARGALILRPNYRGSAGYGAKFRALNVRNLGVGDYADVISGVDYLIGKGMVDKDRVGAMGWSEGGYISAFITASATGSRLSRWEPAFPTG